MAGEWVVLLGGSGGGQRVQVSGATVVWRACLYERTGDHQRVGGMDLRVYAHRPDCCQGYGRGDADGCE
ncbi:hypothetical protein V1634_27225 [Plantactinospora veratri]|uniref:Uncharacterized protein n=1 Tax=Plantactinospora veratri TaxID=1436122 RepID=A0ABU7SKP8_9ACTN